MSVFPWIQPAINKTNADALPLCREIAWDFSLNRPVFTGGEPAEVTGADAVAVWAFQALHTARYRYEAYTFQYGQELDSLIGKAYTEALKQAEAVRIVKECLLINPYITAVRDTEVTLEADHLSIFCRIETIYGEVKMDV